MNYLELLRLVGAGNDRGHHRAGGAGGGPAGDARRAVAEPLPDRRGVRGAGLRGGDRCWMLVDRTAHGERCAAECSSCDPLTQLVKIALLALTVCTIVDFDGRRISPTHVGEYLALILLATVGMMFLVSSKDLLMIFISLELTSLSLYILTAFNKRNIKSAEAALKYFLFGGMSAAFTLFGLSLVYGLSGSTNLQQIAAQLARRAGLGPAAGWRRW